jgi:hypothetical protein
MDRVGGGEKQLEDCTVGKSVISPLSPSLIHGLGVYLCVATEVR